MGTSFIITASGRRLSRGHGHHFLVAIHSHPLRASAHLPIGGWADRPAAVALRATLLQGQKLLSTEGFVVDLRGGLDQILEMGPEKEVSEVDKFAVVLVLDVNHTPAVLAATDLLAVDDNGLLGSDDGKGNKALFRGLAKQCERRYREVDLP